jgi:hypothetical protein
LSAPNKQGGNIMKRWPITTIIVTVLLGLCLVSKPAPAQDEPAVGGTAAADRISADFADFFGTPENADAAIAGLRNGTPFTYTDAAGNSVTIDPPTKAMGHGNTFLTLGLAQEQLAQQGIEQPTAAQFEAVLAGGTLVTNSSGQPVNSELAGILQMRSDGAGWGQIAHSMGVKLGHVVSSIKSGHTYSGPVGSSPVAAGDSEAGAGGKVGKGKALGHGIVSGTGGEISSTGSGQGKATGHGIVNGTGQPAGVDKTGGGTSQGKAKGHFK